MAICIVDIVMVLDMTTIILVDSFLRNVVVVEEVGMAYIQIILQGCQHLKAVDMFMLTNIFHGMNVIYAASINCIGK